MHFRVDKEDYNGNIISYREEQLHCILTEVLQKGFKE